MDFAVVGWPDAGCILELDHREFPYAGKFVRSSTGKAVAREDEGIVAAASFNPDRADPGAVRIRTVTVRNDRQGHGIGSRLLAGLRAKLLANRCERVRIAVNNPYAYQAAYRAGFGYTDEKSGMAELLLEAPGDGSDTRYDQGLAAFAAREDLPDEMQAFVADRRAEGLPAPVDPPRL